MPKRSKPTSARRAASTAQQHASEREHQQAQLERQAIELELQAEELRAQVEQLAQVNADLRASQDATAAAHRETLAEAEQRVRTASQFEAALSAVPIAVAVIDRDLRYITVNAACAAMTGKPIDSHAGRSLREINPALLVELEAMFRRVLDTGEPVFGYQLTRPTPHARDGQIDIVLDVAAFRNADGSIAGICSTATDVTDWLALNRQVARAQQVEAAGQLAAGIAHDFNNLLTIVGSHCDLLLMELPETSSYREDIEEIRRAAERATSLARRMLSTTARRAVVPKPVELGGVALGARDLLEQAVRHKATLVMDCANVSVVTADATQLEQVLLNLVINAVDAMPEPGVITVRTRPVELTAPKRMHPRELAAGPYGELRVVDTGAGMDAATQARIFEPFFTTKPVGKGTGLGLATVYSIVRDLGGGIEVESAEGVGTTFRILLPRVVSEEASGPRRVRTAAAAALPRGSERVLIVEDEDDLRTSVARVLQRQGYSVVEARHGGEALRVIAAENDIALVLSDLHMPGVDGFDMSARARHLGASMPILFMSGSSDPDGEAPELPPMESGRDRFIRKPFDVADLLTTVREMLDPA